jgi:hypothetical protein
MLHTQKQERICSSCEGTISASSTFCPFCGTDFSFEKGDDNEDSFASQAIQEMTNLSSLYKPPYTPNQKGLGVPAYQENQVSSYDEATYTYQQPSNSSTEQTARVEVGLWPLLFLSIGMNLLTIGLLLFFFSDKGKLILEWNSYYWFLYCLLGTPLLMFGWRLLQSSEEVE